MVISGGDWNMNFYFSIYWECHHPNWRTLIFFRGVYHQPVRLDGEFKQQFRWNEGYQIWMSETGSFIQFLYGFRNWMNLILNQSFLKVAFFMQNLNYHKNWGWLYPMTMLVYHLQDWHETYHKQYPESAKLHHLLLNKICFIFILIYYYATLKKFLNILVKSSVL